MAYTVGESKGTKEIGKGKKRYSVTLTVNGKVPDWSKPSAGMLFKTADEAEKWIANSMSVGVVKVVKGMVFSAVEVKARF